MERFAFGENWRNFSKRLTNEDYLNAKNSVRELVGDLSGKTVLDIGCGTGRFLDLVKQVWPRLPSLGLDLSEPYIKYAKRHLRRWSWINFVVGNAESIPTPEASYDAVTSIFMFHELPPKIRRIIFGECARVLKPGGRLVLVDSLQRGDESDYEGLFDLFPQNYHEPY